MESLYRRLGGKNGRQEKFIRGGGRRGSGVGEEEDEKGEERVRM